MQLDKEKATLMELEERSHYFTNIDFPVIADSFRKGADALRRLIETIEKLEQFAPINSEE